MNGIQAAFVGLVPVVDQWFDRDSHALYTAKIVLKVQYNLLYKWQKLAEINGNAINAKTASNLRLTRFLFVFSLFKTCFSLPLLDLNQRPSD